MTDGNNTITGIDIGSKNIRIIQAVPVPDTLHMPRILGVAKSNSEGVHHGYVINPDEVARSIKKSITQLEKTTNTTITEAYVTIGSISLRTCTVQEYIQIGTHEKPHKISVTDTEKLISLCEQTFYNQIKNQKILHCFPVNWKLDGEKILGTAVGMQGTTLSVDCIIVYCLEQHYTNTLSAVSLCDIAVTSVIAAPIAEALVSIPKESRMAGCALVNIGSETLSVSVYENDQLVSLAVFPLGSIYITHDIALGFQVPLEQAELIKCGTHPDANLAKKKLEMIVEARAEDLFEIVINHLRSLDRDILLPGGIIITGGGSMQHNILTMAKKYWGLPVSIPGIEHLFKHSKNSLDQSWFPVLGLCKLPAPIKKISPRGLSGSLTEAKHFMGNLIQHFIP
jgi:cell division protein FtsA